MKNEIPIATQLSPSAKSPDAEAAPSRQPAAALPPPPLTSLLIPCCGQLEYTKLCVPSLLRWTKRPFELIFLDIGSLDGTAEYLAGLATAPHRLRIETVRTPTDLGIADAVKDALSLARGEYVVLLNNDTIVTPGWLHQLIGLANANTKIGIVGPMSNYAAPPQLVENVPYRIGPKRSPGLNGRKTGPEWLVDVSAVEEFAKKVQEENAGKWAQAEHLGGFCLCIKREVLKRIGHLREASDLGMFDTDDLCAKARKAGYALAVCRDLFVHHFGTRTFAHGAPEVVKS